MKLILSKFNLIKKIIILYSIPDQNITDEIQNNLRIIYDKFKDKEILDKFYDFEAYLSYLFRLQSPWYPETSETLVLTLYFEEHENTHLFKDILRKCISELTQISNLSKILYVNTPHADSESYSNFGKAIKILTKCFFDANKLHSTYNLGIAEVLILGNKGGGKTTIVDYLLHRKFIPQSAPTLTPSIYQLVYDNLDFRVLDVCCDEHIKQVLEDHPLEPGKLPQAIVYVVDCSLMESERESSISYFNEWIAYLGSKYSKSIFRKIPFLVLFNKMDLNPEFNQSEYEKYYHYDDLNLNIKYSKVSALSGEGLDENFAWVIKQIKITERY